MPLVCKRENLDLGILSRRAPALAGDLAFRRFSTPALSERRSPDHVQLVERARFHLRSAARACVDTVHGPVQCFIFEPAGARAERNVLVSHGWTSESSFMAVFAEQLRRAGFRVVAFDQPAHGQTGGRRATLIDCTRVLIDVARALGPFHFAVAHSMGSIASLLAGAGGPPFGADGYPFERYVLISSPNRFSDVARAFGEGLGLNERAQRAYERHLERVAHRPLQSFRADRLLSKTGRPALVIHSRDDREVLFTCAEEIAAACPATKLVPFDGLGHRMILTVPPVIRAAVAYLTNTDG